MADGVLDRQHLVRVRHVHHGGRNALGSAEVDPEEENDAVDLGRRAAKGIQAIVEGTAPNVIVSSEGYSYLNDAAALKVFADQLRGHFSTIKIICYLRRQDQFAISHHQEGANPQIKLAAKLHGHRPTALPETNPLQQKYLDYATRIGMWGDAFGDNNIMLRIFDRKVMKSGDAVADFLELVGLGGMEVSTVATKNVSMGFVKTKFGHILNELLSDMQIKGSLLGRVPDEGKLLPRRADAVDFVTPYVEGNRALNQRFRINDSSTLFSDDFGMYPEEGNETWSEATANPALRACIEMIRSLAGDTFIYSRDEYMAAAKALEATSPEMAKRFRESAHGLRPSTEKAKIRAVRIEKRRDRKEAKAAKVLRKVQKADSAAEGKGAASVPAPRRRRAKAAAPAGKPAK